MEKTTAEKIQELKTLRAELLAAAEQLICSFLVAANFSVTNRYQTELDSINVAYPKKDTEEII